MNVEDIRNIRLFNREKISAIWEWIDNKEAIILVGARQAGKTSILYLLIQALIKKGKGINNIFYYDLEDFEILEILNKGVKHFLEHLKFKGAHLDKKVYVFLDEIQYLDNPTNFIKLLVDHYPNIKIIASGSSTLEIRKKFKDSLVGRKIIFEIPTLTFKEFLLFKGEKELTQFLAQYSLERILMGKIKIVDASIFDRKCQILFEEYLAFGGYPAVSLENRETIKKKMLSEIYNTYVRKDINQLFNIDSLSAFNNLTKVLAVQIGSLFNHHSSSKALRIAYLTLERYLFILENTFIVKLVKPFYKNRHKELLKMPKYYFRDIGLRNCIINNFNRLDIRPDSGELIENYIFTVLQNRLDDFDEIKFWRTKSGNEVDFILEKDGIIPLEVKYQEFRNSSVPRNMIYFFNAYKPKKAIILNKNRLDKIKYNHIEVFFIPIWLFG